MAIAKDIQLHNFVNVGYHRIVKWEYSTGDSEMVLVVAQYVSKEAREAGASPVHHEYVRVPLSWFGVHPIDAAYELLEAIESPFSGGTKV